MSLRRSVTVDDRSLEFPKRRPARDAILPRVAKQVGEYKIEHGGTRALSELPGIDVAAGSIFPEEDIPAEQREHGLSLSFFEHAAREGRLFVASKVAGHWPVGFAVTTRVDGSLHLFQLSVTPAHGRQGLGRALVEAVLERASQRAETCVTLTTFRHLAWNAPFYAKLGFQILDARDLGPELVECLAREARDGLDPEKRVAMRIDLVDQA